MSILVTGANGAVGIDLVKNLASKFKIFAIYRSSNENIKKIKNVVWVQADLKKKFLRKFKPKPKFVIHCAVDQRFSKNTKINNYINSNLSILKNIIDFANSNKVKLIVNFSSIEVYGDIKNRILSETYNPQNPNTYGIMKLLSEDILSNQKINYVNLRLPGILCKNIVGNTSRPWLTNIFYKLKTNKKITIYGISKKFNSLINTDDITKLIKFIINNKVNLRNTYNFASTTPINLINLIYYAKKRFKSKSIIIKKKNFKKKPYYISTKKIENNLKYKTLSTKKTVSNHLENFLQARL